MKVVIEIPDFIYDTLIETGKYGFYRFDAKRAIKNGTPLPKGHGRLIDADDIDNHIIGHVDTRSCPTIIEADNAESEERNESI